MSKSASGPNSGKKICFEQKPMRSNSGFDPTKNVLYDIAENVEHEAKDKAMGKTNSGAKCRARGNGEDNYKYHNKNIMIRFKR